MIETTFEPLAWWQSLSAGNGQAKDKAFPADHFRYEPDDTISMSTNFQILKNFISRVIPLIISSV